MIGHTFVPTFPILNKEKVMGRIDGLARRFSEEQSRQGHEVQEQSRGYATSGWRNRGAFFWIMLIIMVYWFFLRPLGL
jgi:hypothetical protein